MGYVRCDVTTGKASLALRGRWTALTAIRLPLPAAVFRATHRMHRVITLAAAGTSPGASVAVHEQAKGHKAALAYAAVLTPLEAGIAIAFSLLSCTAYYLVKAPNHLSLRFALSAALLFAASLTVCRTFLLERKQQGRLMAEQELKDCDSVFRELHGTAVHYKLAQGLNPAHPTAVHCYHGFGANTFSWSYVYKALSEQLCAQVTKHDMPGFGLTQRPRDINAYSLQFNGHLGRLVMDVELAAAGVLNPGELDPQVGPGVSLEELQTVSEKHKSGQGEGEPAATRSSIEAAANKRADDDKSQAGSAQASQDSTQAMTGSREETQASSAPGDSFFPDSQLSSSTSWDSASSVECSSHLSGKQASLSGRGSDSRVLQQGVKRVLVGHSLGAACAAAEVIKHSKDIAGLVLVAPAIITFSSKPKAQSDPGLGRECSTRSPHIRILKVLQAVGEATAKRAAGAVLWLLQPVLVLFLRVLVRSRPFWVRGLSNAWHSRGGVSDELVDAYRLPQLVRGWEIGLVRFVRARVADDRNIVQIVKDTYNGRTPLSQAEQLAHAVADHNIKVLILHGVGDRLVPVSNSRRLARIIPHAELIEYRDCGHVPQEELPEQFIKSVKAFVEQC